jgi:hypothetical protein
MLEENVVVREKVRNMIIDKLVDKYLFKRIKKLDCSFSDLKHEFYILEDVYYYLQREIEGQIKNVHGGEFLDFYYSVLLGVLDVGLELLARLEDMID